MIRIWNWTRIRIDLKCWIRIWIETSSDPYPASREVETKAKATRYHILTLCVVQLMAAEKDYFGMGV